MNTKNNCVPEKGMSVFIIATFFFMVVGCAGMPRAISPDNRIPLAAGTNQEGIFSNGRESLSYTYTVDADSLLLQGKVYPGRSINFMKLRLLFLNEEGSIISGQYIYHSSYRSFTWRRSTFDKRLPIPGGATDISFEFYVEYRIRR